MATPLDERTCPRCGTEYPNPESVKRHLLKEKKCTPNADYVEGSEKVFLDIGNENQKSRAITEINKIMFNTVEEQTPLSTAIRRLSYMSKLLKESDYLREGGTKEILDPFENGLITMFYNEDTDNLVVEKLVLQLETEKRDDSFLEVFYRSFFNVITAIINIKYKILELTHQKEQHIEACNLFRYKRVIFLSYVALKDRLNTRQKCIELDRNLFKRLEKHENIYFNQVLASKFFSDLLKGDPDFFKRLEDKCLEPFIIFSLAVCFQNIYRLTPDIDEPTYTNVCGDSTTFEIVERTQTSHLLKFSSPATYYKRVYFDGTCRAPLTESQFGLYRTIY
jgi:hypothetical protein